MFSKVLLELFGKQHSYPCSSKYFVLKQRLETLYILNFLLAHPLRLSPMVWKGTDKVK